MGERLSYAGEMSSVLAIWQVSTVSVFCGGSHGGVQHASVYTQRV